MGLFTEEKAFFGYKFKVMEPLRIGSCKMKKGDILEVIGYGTAAVSNFIKFNNQRLPFYTFNCGTWRFKQMVGGGYWT